ncbi:hypothetical protein GGQ61_002185 [Phenylobacterium haematophilum]|uniref:Uncharacterized protein n=1 Tax=Phenylobacterium haematophilum TaxID=98513 RepID=A0A839ZZ96_9CAUL|nr:hypothetical protein [Phenylobacterium haematophilum]
MQSCAPIAGAADASNSGWSLQQGGSRDLSDQVVGRPPTRAQEIEDEHRRRTRRQGQDMGRAVARAEPENPTLDRGIRCVRRLRRNFSCTLKSRRVVVETEVRSGCRKHRAEQNGQRHHQTDDQVRPARDTHACAYRLVRDALLCVLRECPHPSHERPIRAPGSLGNTLQNHDSGSPPRHARPPGRRGGLAVALLRRANCGGGSCSEATCSSQWRSKMFFALLTHRLPLTRSPLDGLAPSL